MHIGARGVGRKELAVGCGKWLLWKRQEVAEAAGTFESSALPPALMSPEDKARSVPGAARTGEPPQLSSTTHGASLCYACRRAASPFYLCQVPLVSEAPAWAPRQKGGTQEGPQPWS